MLTNEEKENNIVQVSRKLFQNVPVKELQIQMHDLLVKDTNSGKLYKYRSFDKNGYSLKNLKEGTLHCSKINEFNDPFECKMGISIRPLFDNLYGEKMDKIRKIGEMCLKIIQNRISIEDCSFDEQRIIMKLLSNTTIKDCINRYRENNKFYEDEVFCVKENINVIIESWKIIVSDEMFKDSLGIYADILPDLLAKFTQKDIKSFLEMESFDLAEFARVNQGLDDEDDIGLLTFLSHKFYPENDKDIENLAILFGNLDDTWIKNIENIFLIGCLCTSFKNRLMWSHYADSHKGFCIEYDFNSIHDENLYEIPFPVVYSQNRIQVPWDMVIEGINKKEKIFSFFLRSVLTKDKIWEYENEWRILSISTNNSELKMPPISCIYLGASIEKKNRDEIINIAQKYNIAIKQMKMDRGTYDLHAQDIDLCKNECS